mmetsp:Transcript_12586/g.31391  ORF Transcript_12586/g.31391 Transcript_12586/m.31391 type:complete len:271 (-) Transcript_12586:101-913(-)
MDGQLLGEESVAAHARDKIRVNVLVLLAIIGEEIHQPVVVATELGETDPAIMVAVGEIELVLQDLVDLVTMLRKHLVQETLELFWIQLAVLVRVKGLEHVRRLVKPRRTARELIVHLDELVKVDQPIPILIEHGRDRLDVLAASGEALAEAGRTLLDVETPVLIGVESTEERTQPVGVRLPLLDEFLRVVGVGLVVCRRGGAVSIGAIRPEALALLHVRRHRNLAVLLTAVGARDPIGQRRGARVPFLLAQRHLTGDLRSEAASLHVYSQ